MSLLVSALACHRRSARRPRSGGYGFRCLAETRTCLSQPCPQATPHRQQQPAHTAPGDRHGESLGDRHCGGRYGGWMACRNLGWFRWNLCRTRNLQPHFVRASAVANSVALAVDRLQPCACLFASAPVHVLIDVMATVDSGAAMAQAASMGRTTVAPAIDDRWVASSITRRIVDTL